MVSVPTMRSAEDLLQELTALDESHRIEAKHARQIDRSIMETVCAFANEPGLGGGYLLLGLRRDSHDLFNNAYRVDAAMNFGKQPPQMMTWHAPLHKQHFTRAHGYTP